MKVLDFEPSMAQALADLWNRSEEGWPAGLVRGIVKTPSDIMESLEQVASIANLVAFDGERVVGFASVFPFHDDPTAAYVGTVNVDPEYHGKGFGKALMVRAVEVAMEKGHWRVDLYTWPGNLKAVPLYKRTGFVWLPETHVHMQNFLPGIVASEALKGYFTDHHWYRDLRVLPTMEPDGGEVEGVGVFVYRWCQGREGLTVWVDQVSGGLVGLDGPMGRVLLNPEGPKYLAGVPNSLGLGLEARELPLEGRAEALGFDWQPLGAPQDFKLAPGQATRLTFPFTIPKDHLPPPENAPPPRLRVCLDLQDRRLDLGLGVRAGKPVLVAPVADDLTVLSPRKLTLKVTNNIGREVAARVRIRGGGPLKASLVRRLTLAPDGEELLEVEVDRRGPRPGVGTLVVSVHVEGVDRADDIFPVPCPAPGQTLVYARPSGGWALEDATLRCSVQEYGGTMTLHSKAHGKDMLSDWGEYLGPPYLPATLFHTRWKGELRRDGSLELRTPIPGMEGAEIYRIVSLGGSQLTVRYAISDPLGSLRGKKLRLRWGKGWDFGVLTLPVAGRILQEEIVDFDFPDMWHDIPSKGLVDEGWAHVLDKELGIGMAWCARGGWEVETSPWTTITPTFHTDSMVEGAEATVAVLVAAGWGETRSLWASMAGAAPLAPRGIERLPNLSIHPRVPLLTPQGDVTLNVVNRRRKPVAGTLELELPKGILAIGDPRTVEELSLGREATQTWRLEGPDVASPRVFRGRALFRSPQRGRTVDLPMLVAPRPSEVEMVEDEGLWVVRHEPLTLKVAPSFAGSAVSMVANGKELLLSGYPQAREFSWFNPWHGGLLPQVFRDEIPLDLRGEKFTPRMVQVGPWKGVELTAAPTIGPGKGLQLSTEYLVLPGSPLLALRTTVANTSRLPQELRFGQGMYFQPGAKGTRTHLLKDGWIEREQGRWMAYLRVEGRALVLEPEGGEGILAVACAPDDCDLWLGDYGGLGAHPMPVLDADLAAGGSASISSYVAVVGSVDEGRDMAVLAGRPLVEKSEPLQGQIQDPKIGGKGEE